MRQVKGGTLALFHPSYGVGSQGIQPPVSGCGCADVLQDPSGTYGVAYQPRPGPCAVLQTICAISPDRVSRNSPGFAFACGLQGQSACEPQICGAGGPEKIQACASGFRYASQ